MPDVCRRHVCPRCHHSIVKDLLAKYLFSRANELLIVTTVPPPTPTPTFPAAAKQQVSDLPSRGRGSAVPNAAAARATLTQESWKLDTGLWSLELENDFRRQILESVQLTTGNINSHVVSQIGMLFPLRLWISTKGSVCAHNIYTLNDYHPINIIETEIDPEMFWPALN